MNGPTYPRVVRKMLSNGIVCRSDTDEMADAQGESTDPDDAPNYNARRIERRR
jgi:hypothetical protein